MLNEPRDSMTFFPNSSTVPAFSLPARASTRRPSPVRGQEHALGAGKLIQRLENGIARIDLEAGHGFCSDRVNHLNAERGAQIAGDDG